MNTADISVPLVLFPSEQRTLPMLRSRIHSVLFVHVLHLIKATLLFISLAYTLLLIPHCDNAACWVTLWNSWLVFLNYAANLCRRVWAIYNLWYTLITTLGCICLGTLLEREKIKDWSEEALLVCVCVCVCVCVFLLAVVMILLQNNLLQSPFLPTVLQNCAPKSFYGEKNMYLWKISNIE